MARVAHRDTFHIPKTRRSLAPAAALPHGEGLFGAPFWGPEVAKGRLCRSSESPGKNAAPTVEYPWHSLILGDAHILVLLLDEIHPHDRVGRTSGGRRREPETVTLSLTSAKSEAHDVPMIQLNYCTGINSSNRALLIQL